MTGDTVGAINELAEITALLAACVMVAAGGTFALHKLLPSRPAITPCG